MTKNVNKLSTKKSLNFEESLENLQTIIERMEDSDGSIADAIKDFERGLSITRELQNKLKNIEQHVKLLSQEGDSPVELDLDGQLA